MTYNEYRRVLILGAGGFVGHYLIRDLKARFGASADIIATSRRSGNGLIKLDLSNDAALRNILSDLEPTHIVNLVGIAAPMEAHQNPAAAWELHAMAPKRLGHLILETVPNCWLLHVGSGLVYGRSALDFSSVDEHAVLQPMDTYGVTKAAGDLALGALAEEGLRCLRLRPFNHIGPEQSDKFAIPSFALQIARIEAGLQPPVVRTGNLDTVRDFLDVRDVVAAYSQIILRSEQLTPGSIFNISSGTGWEMSALLKEILSNSDLDIAIEEKVTQQRKGDVLKIIGDASMLQRAITWAPQYSIPQTLRDILESSRRHISTHSN